MNAWNYPVFKKCLKRNFDKRNISRNQLFLFHVDWGLFFGNLKGEICQKEFWKIFYTVILWKSVFAGSDFDSHTESRNDSPFLVVKTNYKISAVCCFELLAIAIFMQKGGLWWEISKPYGLMQIAVFGNASAS